MADYPNEIFTPREIENMPGVEYNENNKKTLYAEDFEALSSEIQAIEEILGIEINADYETVKAWLEYLSENALGGDVSKVGTPVNKQIGVWTGDGTLQGLPEFTYENLPGGGNGGELIIGKENTNSYIRARNATTANTWGGTLHLTGGNGNGTGRGGSFVLRGGTGGSGDGGHGGGVGVYGANAIGSGNGDGGDVSFYVGAGKGTGRDGRYSFEIPGDRAMLWDLSNLDDFYDFVFPNGGGTFAMQSSATGSFTTVDGKTVSVVNGIITSIV